MVVPCWGFPWAMMLRSGCGSFRSSLICLGIYCIHTVPCLVVVASMYPLYNRHLPGVDDGDARLLLAPFLGNRWDNIHAQLGGANLPVSRLH